LDPKFVGVTDAGLIRAYLSKLRRLLIVESVLIFCPGLPVDLAGLPAALGLTGPSEIRS
jgi:hypothetical protein